MRYGKWPHEVANLPFHYYLALREDWIGANTAAPVEDEADELDEVGMNTESFRGEAV